MARGGSLIRVQISIEVTEEMRLAAESRGLPLVDYVEMLMARGRQAIEEAPAVSSAIERIRALRAGTTSPRT